MISHKHKKLTKSDIIFTVIIFLMIAALCIVIIFFNKTSDDTDSSWLEEEHEELPQWDYKDSVFIDTENNIEYYQAPSNFQPYSSGQDYAAIGSLVIKTIPGLDPTNYLVVVMDKDYTVLYNPDAVTLPSYEDFSPNSIKICIEDEKIVQINSIDDITSVYDIHELLFDGISGKFPYEYNDVYHLKFTSENYPKLYYDVTYYVTDNGNYIYDRNQLVYAESGDLIQQYIDID